MSEPTKLPWKLDDPEDPMYIMDSEGRTVMETRGHGHLTRAEVTGHAHFVVLAVNFHQRLVDALRDLRDEYESQKAQFGSDPIWKKYEDAEVSNQASALLAEIEKEAHGS